MSDEMPRTLLGLPIVEKEFAEPTPSIMVGEFADLGKPFAVIRLGKRESDRSLRLNTGGDPIVLIGVNEAHEAAIRFALSGKEPFIVLSETDISTVIDPRQVFVDVEVFDYPLHRQMIPLELLPEKFKILGNSLVMPKING